MNHIAQYHPSPVLLHSLGLAAMQLLVGATHLLVNVQLAVHTMQIQHDDESLRRWVNWVVTCPPQLVM